MKLDGAVFALPELLRLSMFCCPIHNEGGIRFTLPKLKHLAFISPRSHIYPQEVTFLDRLVSKLTSFTAHLDQTTVLPPSIINHPTLPILFTTWWITPVAKSLQGVRHLLLQLRGPQGQIPPDWTDEIKNSAHQLETLTLEWSGGGIRPEASATRLLSACEAQNVEVLWQHQPDHKTSAATIETFFNVVPSSFIQRSEARQARK